MDHARNNIDFKDPQLLHTCWKCSKTFDELNAFKRHSWKHTDRHVCTDCGRVMSSKERLNTHKAAIHGDSANPNAEIEKREKVVAMFNQLKEERIKKPDKCKDRFIERVKMSYVKSRRSRAF